MMLNWKERLRGGVVQGVLHLDLGEASDHNDFKATVLAHKGVHFHFWEVREVTDRTETY